MAVPEPDGILLLAITRLTETLLAGLRGRVSC